ncbi:hypothetical protein ES319_A11G308500v1 [Gossypium barbadense]|uniref:Uncharacterized protein n=1 Tax=Gossypium barbadense TaxID=3634 RepID=A0A5J5TYL8_GOSBA|nr:hypothetical protein ES319_A11G308500v1 [Gossypium barbadense]
MTFQIWFKLSFSFLQKNVTDPIFLFSSLKNKDSFSSKKENQISNTPIFALLQQIIERQSDHPFFEPNFDDGEGLSGAVTVGSVVGGVVDVGTDVVRGCERGGVGCEAADEHAVLVKGACCFLIFCLGF